MRWLDVCLCGCMAWILWECMPPSKQLLCCSTHFSATYSTFQAYTQHQAKEKTATMKWLGASSRIHSIHKYAHCGLSLIFMASLLIGSHVSTLAYDICYEFWRILGCTIAFDIYIHQIPIFWHTELCDDVHTIAKSIPVSTSMFKEEYQRRRGSSQINRISCLWYEQMWL